MAASGRRDVEDFGEEDAAGRFPWVHSLKDPKSLGNIWKSMELLKNGGCNAKIWEIIEVGSGDFSGMNGGPRLERWRRKTMP